MTRFVAPNTCQVPNDFFDVLLPQLGDAELRVMLYLMRQTFGWNRDWTEKGYGRLDQICKSAGISRQGAINALKGLKERGAVESRKVGVAFEYRVRVHDVDTSTDQTPPVNVVDRPDVQSTTLTDIGQPGGPDSVNVVDREPVNVVDCIKRQSSKPTENPNEEAAAVAAEDAGEAARSAAAGPAVDVDAVDLVDAEPEPLTLAGAVGQVAYGHLDAVPTGQRRELTRVTILLKRDGYSAGDVLEADEHWRRGHARRHGGHEPTSAKLTQVYTHCAEWRRATRPAGPLFDREAYGMPAEEFAAACEELANASSDPAPPSAAEKAVSLWATISNAVRVSMAPATFAAHLRDARARCIDGDGVLVVEVPKATSRDWLRARLLHDLDDAFQSAVLAEREAGEVTAVDWMIVAAGEEPVVVDVAAEREALPA